MTDPRTFDLFAEDEQVKYAEGVIRVVRNRMALYEAIKLDQQINSGKLSNVAEAEAQLAALREEVDASTYSVTLRGIPVVQAQQIRSAVKAERFPDVDENDGKPHDELNTAANVAVLEKMLLKIEDAEGREAALPTGDKVLLWYNGLPEEAKLDILEIVGDLTYSAMRLDAETGSPDF